MYAYNNRYSSPNTLSYKEDGTGWYRAKLAVRIKTDPTDRGCRSGTGGFLFLF